MTGRVLTHALTRIGFLVPAGIGVALLATGASTIAGGILIGVGLLRLLRMATKRGLDAELAFREAKKRHGVSRYLKSSERQLLEQLDRYCLRLRETALESDLAEETMKEGWELVRTARGQNATPELQAFFDGLPTLDLSSKDGVDTEVAVRIKEDLERRRKIEREIEG